MRRLVKICFAQSGYGSGLLPLVYSSRKKCIFDSISVVLLLKLFFQYTFLLLK